MAAACPSLHDPGAHARNVEAKAVVGALHSAAVTRHFLLVALLLSVLGQAATVGGRWALGGGDAAAHALLHWIGAAHHHGHAHDHDEEHTASSPEALGGSSHASFHQDQSPDSLKHLHADGYLASLGLLHEVQLRFARPLAGAAPAVHRERPPPSPFLEGLIRPPRALS